MARNGLGGFDSKVLKWLEMSEAPKWPEMVWEAPKWPEMVWEALKLPNNLGGF